MLSEHKKELADNLYNYVNSVLPEHLILFANEKSRELNLIRKTADVTVSYLRAATSKKHTTISISVNNPPLVEAGA